MFFPDNLLVKYWKIKSNTRKTNMYLQRNIQQHARLSWPSHQLLSTR